MIATRPDWCISRQRLWGVPIPAFYCRGCQTPFLTAGAARHVADVFEKESADAWYDRPAADLLPPGARCPSCGGTDFDKERDILDVWFDSGSSHAAVLGRRPDLPWPADVYLEGSDQHRGWFHSSLLIGVATRGRAPYKKVITHGFTVDAQGRKISKSLGNDVDTQKLINTYGAEVLRLWVTMSDYRGDMSFSLEMLKGIAEAYRKIRNTCRYLLSNLYDFDPGKDAVAEGKLEQMDTYALMKHTMFRDRVLDAYQANEYHIVYHELIDYCADISSVYLDILKDRLYCDAAASPRRRSAQTVLYGVASDLTRLIAPILPFTADEAWSFIPGARGSVHEQVFPKKSQGQDYGSVRDWSESLFPVREEVLKQLELARAAKQIGSSLEAKVRITAPKETVARLRTYEEQGPPFPGNLANLFIVSRVELAEGDGDVAVQVSRAPGAKCERCWTYSEKVGRLSHPGLCERCTPVLEAR
jgi:isoleucyl-tRNA synthetase